MSQLFTFQIEKTDHQARRATLRTPHGSVETPCWIPVGTQASVKGLTPHDLKEIGVQIVLGNTYHLNLRPGADVVEKLGGLAPFMAWDGPTMTDSGGYQVFSLGTAHEAAEGKLSKFVLQDVTPAEQKFIESDRLKILKNAKSGRIRPAKIDEDGVTFYSHLDGSEHRLDPQISIRFQEQLGADLIVEFDDHESPLWDYEQTEKSLERTNRWGLESLKAQTRSDQLMYGVIHGGIYEDLRRASAQFTDQHFPAIAIGGSYTSKEILYKVLEWTLPHTDPQKPRHLLGIAEIMDLFEGVERGIDFFDCVAATRRARHGNIYLSPRNGGTVKNSFSLQITNTAFTADSQPLDPGCSCYTCQTFSRAYLSHLFKAQELLAYRLATYHNVYFVTHLMEQVREAISEKRFAALKTSWLSY